MKKLKRGIKKIAYLQGQIGMAVMMITFVYASFFYANLKRDKDEEQGENIFLIFFTPVGGKDLVAYEYERDTYKYNQGVKICLLWILEHY